MTAYFVNPQEFRQIRESANLTRTELAKFLGVSSISTITNYETGRTQMPLPTFLRFCSIFQVEPNDFIIRATMAD